ncbi:MAG: endonuclease/exonuclease/phosphatase family protein [Saprospiraceae bacterium]|jgi:endonuclease/exonuclease/phosphatase family metal-dependent hydrolase|nr:endonuclease/exonuclease/phosphatase family protein [Saprospiraceae bacterium]
MLQRLFLFVNIALVTGTFLAYLAPHIDPETTWVVAFFGLFYPLFLVGNVLFIILWFWIKPRLALLSVACLALGWSEFSSFIGFHSTIPSDGNKELRITSYNISNGLYGYSRSKDNRKEKREAFVEYLHEFDSTDVFCLQEVREYGYDIIRKSFPAYKLHHTGKGAIILSRFPILKKGEIDFGTITNSCLWADVNTGFDTIRFYSFHLQSNQISIDAENLSNQSEIDQKKTWYDIKGMLRKFKNRHITRSRQAEKIAAHAKKSPHPVVLSGDLNDPPQSYTYQVLSRLGKDSFCEKGRGLGTTYAGKIPLLRIDYIFSDHDFSVVDFEIHKEQFSDHFAVSTTLEWPEKKEFQDNSDQ